MSGTSPRPSLLERRISSASSRSVELAMPPDLVASVLVSNTLVFAGLTGKTDFVPSTIDGLRDRVNEISNHTLIHWGLLPSFGRVFAVFQSSEMALVVRTQLNETVYNEESSLIRVYFADETPIRPLLRKSGDGGMPSAIDRERDNTYLKLPESKTLFLISPPPSPPVGWESTEEGPPNLDHGVAPEILSQALNKLTFIGTDSDQNYNSSSPSSDKSYGAQIYGEFKSNAATPSSSIVVVPPDHILGQPGIVISDFSTLSDPIKRSVAGVRTERPPIDA
ncbi:Calcipressin-domain-containing protein [Lipomyces arxii]|uniref:Calcipressin-domain-containing protein n=1 Tax=Lipomyces arxii TaxID=56418 RepID=UPI0034CF93D5